jgi:hypothetical protein
MKNDYVQVSDGSQMHEVRKMAGAQSYGFRIKRRGRDAGSLENHSSDGVEQSLREIRLDGGSPYRSQQFTRGEIEISFLAHICRDSGAHLGYTCLRKVTRIHCSSTFSS